MIEHNNDKPKSAVFITFPGNCKKALKLYQTLFGGNLQFNSFEKKLQGFSEIPVVNGCLTSESIVIHGSDLVHDEGRKPGNHMSIFLQCSNADNRRGLIKKLLPGTEKNSRINDDDKRLIEITDVFEVRWILGV